jgi:hypothetical protein
VEYEFGDVMKPGPNGNPGLRLMFLGVDMWGNDVAVVIATPEHWLPSVLALSPRKDSWVKDESWPALT